MDVLAAQPAKQGHGIHQGKIEITSTPVERDGKSGILMTVSDNGQGLAQALQHKIFAQFFTTKPPGIGTGLGLSLCKRIINSHGGTIAVDQCPTLGGACFRVWLPVHDAGNP